MRTITFRPLRRIKKTGKITVASYLQWNKVRCANNEPHELVVNPEYRQFKDHEEYVYNHEGELLYFYKYNPNDIPVVPSSQLDFAHSMYRVRCIDFNGFYSYSGIGIDCEGTPTFSHFTADYLGTHSYDPNDFEPLTVGKVLQWYEWFIYRLDKANISCR